METELKPNNGKSLVINVEGVNYERWPIRTHIITEQDDMVEVAQKYAAPHLQDGDYLFISERIVAISQGRAFPIKEIIPSKLANFLVRFVHKSPYGIGLASPWTMELAIREAGVSRMLFAAFCSAVTKPFGLKGIFYKVVGKNINAIDGPCSYTLPPFNEYAKLGPAKPNQVAKELKNILDAKIEVVIIDANDLGVNVLGLSNQAIKPEFCQAIFKDNPLGQSAEQTPMCVVRKK
jgi:F420-0:gamma-glutamyl ligase-like protein